MNAADIKKARADWGVSFLDILNAAKKLGPGFSADYCARYALASNCAVAVHGDRHAWNKRRAGSMHK